MKQIIIFCDGGLGNRMNCLIGGLLLAKKINRTPIINWPSNTWCGAEFNQIFKDNEYTIDNKNINELFTAHRDTAAFVIHNNQTNLVLNKLYNVSKTSIQQIDDIQEDTIIYYHHHIPTLHSVEEQIDMLSTLPIQASILNTVDEFCESNDISKNTIGYHFRRTDQPLPPSADVVYQKASTTKFKFFICSDDAHTESIFSELPNVYMYPKTKYADKHIQGNWRMNLKDLEGRSTTYNISRSAQSVIEAVVDMLILSKTNIQVHSASSFLSLTALYSKIK